MISDDRDAKWVEGQILKDCPHQTCTAWFEFPSNDAAQVAIAQFIAKGTRARSDGGSQLVSVEFERDQAGVVAGVMQRFGGTYMTPKPRV